MPLVRVEVRNEYGLGTPELYKTEDGEDPKPVLDGVAVAGLVGILRQLGDLADFAAEVFHGLQEQVMITSSRSRKLIHRLQHIEAVFPPIEKLILAQRSHLHFAYTTGTNWHSRVQNVQNHFIYGDLPRFIMDSYEECRVPPHLQLLDKFDVGGPGSCLKRYSDPTFFKRASIYSNEANIKKVTKDNRCRRTKKKRSWDRNGEKSQTTLSRFSDSMQIASLSGQNSSETVSTVNVDSKSDLLGKSDSESRKGSDFIECTFHPCNSEVLEPKKSPSRQSCLQKDDTFSSTFVDGETMGLDNIVKNSPSEVHSHPGSTCVWDEKTEIVGPAGQQCGHDGSPQVVSTNLHLEDLERAAVQATGQTYDLSKEQDVPFVIFDQDVQVKKTMTCGGVDQLGFQYENSDMAILISDGNLHDSFESETDNYMDALNFIELESETDVDYQTKHEVDHYSNLNSKSTEVVMFRQGTGDAQFNTSYSEPQTAADSSSNDIIAGDNSNTLSEESKAFSLSNEEISGDHSNTESYEFYHLVSQQMACESPRLSTPPNIDLCGSVDVRGSSNVEPMIRNMNSCESKEPNLYSYSSEGIVGMYDSLKTQPESATSNSVKFWTNGGLLGLEPSKPPDFRVVNAVSQDHKNDTVDPFGKTNTFLSDGNVGKSHITSMDPKIFEGDPHYKCSTSYDLGDDIPHKQNFTKPINANVDDKLTTSHSDWRSSNEMSRTTLGKENQCSSEAQSIQVVLESCKGSSRMFELSNRFELNMQSCLPIDNTFDPSSSLSTVLSEQKSKHEIVQHQNLFGRSKVLIQNKSPFISPPPSPPLELMRISFQPTDGYESYKLKLKFPNGFNSLGTCEDLFPSFQLVPEPAISLYDPGSDFDDDTFSRSICMSDDCPSPGSESNSEHWDSDGCCSKDPEFPVSLEMREDSNGGISNNCRLQNSFSEIGSEFSQSCSLRDLPLFVSLNVSLEQESAKAVDLDGEHHVCKGSSPPPPPLPPKLWRSMKLNTDALQKKQDDDAVESFDHAADSALSEVNILHQPKAGTARSDCNIESPDIPIKPSNTLVKKHRQNGHNKVAQDVNGDTVDDNDFLYQIRAKSFNLRPTVMAKPTVEEDPPSNASVSAILKKASAIRQVVGSDDGEDEDTWSDT